MKISRATFERIIRTLCRQQQSQVNTDLPARKTEQLTEFSSPRRQQLLAYYDLS